VRKFLLHPNESQKRAFGFLFGARRHFHNTTKAICDKASSEAMEARVCELVRDHDDGLCHHTACANPVCEADGDYESKKRWYCEQHVKDARFGAKPRITGRSRPWEKQSEAAGHVCVTEGCKSVTVEDTLRCLEHQDAGANDPKCPAASSPYNFHTVKSIACPPDEDLLDDQKWYSRVPCNLKTAAIKQYTAAAAATFTKWRKGDTRARLPGFLSRKDRQQEFSVRDTAIQFKRDKQKSPPKKKKRRKSWKPPTKRGGGAKKSPRRSGRRTTPWRLRIFPNTKTAAQLGLTGREAVGADGVSAAMRAPIRMHRREMVRMKRAQSLGDWGESKIQKDKCGRYHLILVIKVSEAQAKAIVLTEQPYQDAFLDPGGRTFHTMYCPDGVAAKIGDNFYALMLPRLRRSDRIDGAAASLGAKPPDDAAARKKTRRKIKRMRARAQRLRTRVYNCVRDLHRKTARFLCINFKAVHIPAFKAGRPRPRSMELARRINSKAVRNLMTFAHAEFLTTLQAYASVRGVHVVVVGEAYTTKTCTFCGHLNDVGAKKTIKCQACGLKADRDYAGSRNVGLRTATATS
jgi:putative transposase